MPREKSDLPPLPPSPFKKPEAIKPRPTHHLLPGFNRSADWMAIGTRGPIGDPREVSRDLDKDMYRAMKRGGPNRDLSKRPLNLKSLRGGKR